MLRNLAKLSLGALFLYCIFQAERLRTLYPSLRQNLIHPAKSDSFFAGKHPIPVAAPHRPLYDDRPDPERLADRTIPAVPPPPTGALIRGSRRRGWLFAAPAYCFAGRDVVGREAASPGSSSPRNGRAARLIYLWPALPLSAG